MEMAGRIEALNGQVIDVIGALALAPRPVEDRAAPGVAYLLLVVVKRLVAGFFPEEVEVSGHRYQSLADRSAPRKVHGAVVAEVVGGREVALDGGVREIARGHDVGNLGLERALGLVGLGEMNFQKAAVSSVEVDERVDGLDDAGSGRPAAAHARGERHNGDLSARDGRLAVTDRGRRRRLADLDQLVVRDVADVEIDGQLVAGQADAAALEVVAQLFVLDRVKAVVAADPGGLLVPVGPRDIIGRPRDGEKMIDRGPENMKKRAGIGTAVGEMVDVGPAVVREVFGPGLDHSWNLERVVGRRHHRQRARVEGGERPAVVDAEVVHDRLHRKRQRVIEHDLDSFMIAAIAR